MRVNYFYGADIERVNFKNIEKEIKNRVNTAVSSQTNKRIENLITDDEGSKLNVDSPLAIVMGNYFKVIIIL